MISGKQFKKLHPEKFIALSSEKQFKQPIEIIPLNELADNLIRKYKSMLYYANVTISDDSDIIIGPKNDISSSNVILSEIKELTEHELWYDEDFCKKVLVKYHYILKYVKCQTPEICKLAVDFFADNFQFVHDKTYDLCLIAVKNNGLMLQFIDNQTYELCLEAVKNNGWALQYVKLDQTDELCLEAVKSKSETLQFVQNQTHEICKVAIENNARAIKHVKEQTDELCWIALKKDAYSYHEIKNPTNDMLKYGVEHCPLILRRLENSSDELLLLALRHSTWPLMWDDIRARMTFDMYKQAVKYNGLVLEYVDNPTFEMCHDAVVENSISLKFIKDKTVYNELYDLAFKLYENKYHAIFNLIEQLKITDNQNIKWIEENYSKEKRLVMATLYFNIFRDVIWGFGEHLDFYNELFEKYGVDHYKGKNNYYQSCLSYGDSEIIANHRILLYAIVHSNVEYIFEFMMGNFTRLINQPLDMHSTYKMNHAIYDLMYEIKYGNDHKIGKVIMIHEWNPDYSDSRYKLPEWLEGVINNNKNKEDNNEIENEEN